MTPAAGLGKEDPFRRRQQAAESFIPRPATAEPDASELASVLASARKSADQRPSEPDSAGSSLKQPAPPPVKEPTGRTQMNVRITVDRMKALKQYQRKHGATFQAVVDQMVDEYLERRGLLPPDRPQ